MLLYVYLKKRIQNNNLYTESQWNNNDNYYTLEGLSKLNWSENKPLFINETNLLEEEKYCSINEAKVYTNIGYWDSTSGSIIHDTSEDVVKSIEKEHNNEIKTFQEISNICTDNSHESLNRKNAVPINNTGAHMTVPSKINVSSKYEII